MAYINGVFIDDVVSKQIPEIIHSVMKKDKDKHILIDGREGTGKSVLAMQLAKALDADFNIDKIAFNADQFIDLVKSPTRKKGDCIILDEAFGSANSRATLSQINRAMVQMGTEMRQLNLFIIIVLPSFFDLDKYFAIWRSDTLFHVYYNDDGDRGQYIIFPFKDKLDLYIFGKKTYNYLAHKSPYPPCRFNKGYVIDEIEYRKRKAQAFRDRKVSTIDKIWKDRCCRIMDFMSHTQGLTHAQIGKIVGMNLENVRKVLQNWVLAGGKEENIVLNLQNDEV